MSQRSKDFWGTMLMLVIVVLVFFWGSFWWESATGVTVAPKYGIGRNAGPQHIESSRRKAVAATIICSIVGGFCWVARRSQDRRE